mmetsp:Transcript_25075/g.65394  ORF Transcript_25075/g.65394 Transcript_25075/m.65394 type:complete len:274 (-) Transcript_25075:1124-1945(-)
MLLPCMTLWGHPTSRHSPRWPSTLNGPTRQPSLERRRTQPPRSCGPGSYRATPSPRQAGSTTTVSSLMGLLRGSAAVTRSAGSLRSGGTQRGPFGAWSTTSSATWSPRAGGLSPPSRWGPQPRATQGRSRGDPTSTLRSGCGSCARGPFRSTTCGDHSLKSSGRFRRARSSRWCIRQTRQQLPPWLASACYERQTRLRQTSSVAHCSACPTRGRSLRQWPRLVSPNFGATTSPTLWARSCRRGSNSTTSCPTRFLSQRESIGCIGCTRCSSWW